MSSETSGLLIAMVAGIALAASGFVLTDPVFDSPESSPATTTSAPTTQVVEAQ